MYSFCWLIMLSWIWHYSKSVKFFYGKILANQVNKVAFTNFQRLCSFWRKVHPLQIKAACRPPPPPKYDACQIFQLEYRPLNSPASHCTCDKWSHHLLNFNDFNFLLSALISVITKISIWGAQPIVIKLGSSDWFWRLTNNQQPTKKLNRRLWCSSKFFLSMTKENENSER